MSPARSCNRRLPRLAAVLAIAAACPSASAQDDGEQQQPAPGRVEERALLLGRIRVNMLRREFGPVESVRERLNRELAKRINWLEREYRLTESQKSKLTVAGKGDIKRAIDRFESLQEQLERAQEEVAKLGNCQQEFAQFQEHLQRGLFGPESLFAKTMVTTITHDQRTKARTARRRGELARYRATLADTATTLAIALGLNDEQTQALKKLLTDEIDPPVQIGESDRAYIMFWFSQLPAAKVKPIFNDSQWQLLCKVRSSWATRESLLTKGGFELVEDPAESPGRD